jgi:AraC family transcriptional regulator, 4-hydroxyphenylacetate 3-monooxygenase operon regulatory protein
MKKQNAKDEILLHADSCETVKGAVEAGEMELFGIARNKYPGSPFKANEVPGISSFGFWKTTGKQSSGLPTHQNEGIELTVALQGETPVTVDGVSHVLGQGQIMITRPWQKHSIGNPCFSQGRVGWLIIDVGVRHPHQEWVWPDWILLNKNELKSLTRALRQNEDAIRPVSPAYIELFNRLLLIAKSPEQPHRATRIALLVNSMLLELFVTFDATPTTYKESLTDSMRSIRLFLDQLPKRLQEPWTLQTMAEACGIGLTRFSTQFSTLTGESPAKYLMNLRMETAAKLLQNRAIPLQQIVKQVGFTTPSYFIQVFSRHHGHTPAVYRKLMTAN